MDETIIIFITTRILLFSLFVICGWKLQYSPNKKFILLVVLVGLLYSVIEGLRWMRGVDYEHYYLDLTTNFRAIESSNKPELLYKLYVNLTYSLGVPFYWSFILYSALLVIPLLKICIKYRYVAFWVLSLFFVFTIEQSENLIRQYIAIGLLLFAVFYYMQGNKKQMYFFLIATFFIHSTSLLVIVPFLFLIFKNYTFKSPWILLIIYCFCFCFWKDSYHSLIAGYIGNLNADVGIGSGYLQNPDRWFTVEGGTFKNAGVVTLINLVHRFFFFFSIIWFGFKAQKVNIKLRTFFYLSYVAIILKSIAGDIEMYNRLYNWFIIFIPLTVGFTIHENKRNRGTWILSALSLIYIIYGGIFRIFNMQNLIMCDFIWNR